jgi:hypothetical protein
MLPALAVRLAELRRLEGDNNPYEQEGDNKPVPKWAEPAVDLVKNGDNISFSEALQSADDSEEVVVAIDFGNVRMGGTPVWENIVNSTYFSSSQGQAVLKDMDLVSSPDAYGTRSIFEKTENVDKEDALMRGIVVKTVMLKKKWVPGMRVIAAPTSAYAARVGTLVEQQQQHKTVAKKWKVNWESLEEVKAHLNVKTLGGGEIDVDENYSFFVEGSEEQLTRSQLLALDQNTCVFALKSEVEDGCVLESELVFAGDIEMKTALVSEVEQLDSMADACCAKGQALIEALQQVSKRGEVDPKTVDFGRTMGGSIELKFSKGDEEFVVVMSSASRGRVAGACREAMASLCASLAV